MLVTIATKATEMQKNKLNILSTYTGGSHRVLATWCHSAQVVASSATPCRCSAIDPSYMGKQSLARVLPGLYIQPTSSTSSIHVTRHHMHDSRHPHRFNTPAQVSAVADGHTCLTHIVPYTEDKSVGPMWPLVKKALPTEVFHLLFTVAQSLCAVQSYKTVVSL